MSPISASDILATTLSAIQASVSVLLVLSYGYFTRRLDFMSTEAEHGISKLSVTFFLPSLLFSQIGPLATPSNLGSYWIIIVLSLLNQGVSYLVGFIGVEWLKFPQWIIPCLIFNNATSLPLLLIDSLAKTPNSSLKDLATFPGDNVQEIQKRARVYFLINSLVCNLVRFSAGPYLMKDQSPHLFTHLETPHLHLMDSAKDAVGAIESAAEGVVDHLPIVGNHHPSSNGAGPSHSEYPAVVPYPSVDDAESDETQPLLSRSRAKTFGQNIKTKAISVYRGVNKYINPPMWGGGLAVLAGLVPFLRHTLFDQEGILHPFSQSVDNLGSLYTVLQMFVLGAHLYSKKGSRPPILPIVYLFVFRFLLSPVISGGFVILARKWLGSVIKADKVLDFTLVMSPVGPPALTLAAIAEMSDAGDSTQSAVAMTIMISYIITPLISFSVAGAMAVVNIVY